MLSTLEGCRTKICLGIAGLAYALYLAGTAVNVPTIDKETLDNILTACGIGAGWFMRSAINKH